VPRRVKEATEKVGGGEAKPGEPTAAPSGMTAEERRRGEEAIRLDWERAEAQAAREREEDVMRKAQTALEGYGAGPRGSYLPPRRLPRVRLLKAHCGKRFRGVCLLVRDSWKPSRRLLTWRGSDRR